MRRLTATLAILAATAAPSVGCSSDTGEGTNGLSGGSGGKIGVGKGGTTGSAATSGSSNGATGGTGHIDPTGTGGTSGSSGTAGDLGTGGACVGTNATGQKGAGAVVLFLVDTSLSMNDRVGMSTKIAATQSALDASFKTLDAALNVGLVFFPHVPTSTMPCFDKTVEVPIAPLSSAQLMTLTSAVNGAMASGSTPTHDAYAFAVQTLQQSQAMGDKYIVLITDGEPTYALGCVGTGMPNPASPTPTQPLIDAAQMANTSDGIKTFVVGSPGSEAARSALSAMARVGGTGPAGCDDSGTPEYCHFDMTKATTDFGTSLSAALGQIQQQIPVDCAFNLPQPPSGMNLDLNMINVTVTNDDGTKTDIAKDPNGDCATDGWIYVGNPPTSVQLCGTLCDTVKAERNPSIDVQFGCMQRVNPPK